jgi:phage-related protein
MLIFAGTVIQLQQQYARRRTKCFSWRTPLQSVRLSVISTALARTKGQNVCSITQITAHSSVRALRWRGNKKATNINTITGKICVLRNFKSLSKQFKSIKTFALAVESVHHVTVAVGTFSCKSQQWRMQGKRTPSYYSTLTLPPLSFKHLSITLQG